MAVMMSYSKFLETLKNEVPSSDWPEALQALWFDAKGNWEASHTIAQDLHSNLGSWIHAYLHRKEGDKFNAGYWYRRANKPFPNNSLEEEHQMITEFVLSNYN